MWILEYSFTMPATAENFAGEYMEAQETYESRAELNKEVSILSKMQNVWNINYYRIAD